MEGLSRKERMLLQEQLKHEQVCISKYRSRAARASPAVREMFTEFAREEEEHHRTLSALLAQRPDELAATSGERPIPVDAFGRQTAWQSTARQMLFRHEISAGTGYPERSHRWGGLLPGDVPDTNHGDVTRGGLDRRGVAFASPGDMQSPPRGSRLDVHEDVRESVRKGVNEDISEGFPPPSGTAHGMPSHLERDGPNGGQEPAGVSPQDATSQFQRWRGPVPPSAPQYLWYGPTDEQAKQAGPAPTALVRPSGPVSLPYTRMEAAQEWDGTDLSPWSSLTSPVPLDGEVQERPHAPRQGQVGPANAEENDDTMLIDMLMTERFISGAYDSAVFGSPHPHVRRALQQIQRDEQRHGERIAERISRQPSEG